MLRPDEAGEVLEGEGVDVVCGIDDSVELLEGLGNSEDGVTPPAYIPASTFDQCRAPVLHGARRTIASFYGILSDLLEVLGR